MRLAIALVTCVFLATLAPSATASDCALLMPSEVPIGESLDFCMLAPPGSNVFLISSLNDDGMASKFGPLCPGNPLTLIFFINAGPDGEVCFNHPVPCDPSVIGFSAYFQFVAIAPTGESCVSNCVHVTAVDGPCNDEPCEPCDGQVKNLTLQYNGAAAGEVTVIMQQGGHVVFGPQNVNPGEQFSFVGQSNQDTLGPEIDVFVDGGLNAEFHTSCSQPIGPGTTEGDFVVITGDSKNGGLLCPPED